MKALAARKNENGGADRIGVEIGDARRRRADTKPTDATQKALAMQIPKRLRRRIGTRIGEFIVEARSRAMRQIGILIDPGERGLARWEAQAEEQHKGGDERNTEETDAQFTPERADLKPKTCKRDRNEKANQEQRRHERPPELLPEKNGAGAHDQLVELAHRHISILVIFRLGQ